MSVIAFTAYTVRRRSPKQICAQSIANLYIRKLLGMFQGSWKLLLELIIRDLELKRGVQNDGERSPIQMRERKKRGIIHEGLNRRRISDFEEMNERLPLQMAHQFCFVGDIGPINREKLIPIANSSALLPLLHTLHNLFVVLLERLVNALPSTHPLRFLPTCQLSFAKRQNMNRFRCRMEQIERIFEWIGSGIAPRTNRDRLRERWGERSKQSAHGKRGMRRDVELR